MIRDALTTVTCALKRFRLPTCRVLPVCTSSLLVCKLPDDIVTVPPNVPTAPAENETEAPPRLFPHRQSELVATRAPAPATVSVPGELMPTSIEPVLDRLEPLYT